MLLPVLQLELLWWTSCLVECHGGFLAIFAVPTPERPIATQCAKHRLIGIPERSSINMSAQAFLNRSSRNNEL